MATRHVAISPDGKWLTYITRQADGAFRVQLMDLASGQAQSLTTSRDDESPSFAPNSFISTGGGMKGFKDAPEDWEGYVKNYFGLETIGMFYGMSEVMSIQ